MRHCLYTQGEYDKATPGSGSSYLPRANAYYRKHFNLPNDWHTNGNTVWIYFEGVFQTASVYLNGELLGFQECGYTSFGYRLDNVSSVKYGEGTSNENVIALFVDGAKGSGWWYEGAGLYRHVQLIATSKQHIEMDGVFAPATVVGPIQSGTAPADGHTADATIHASVTVVNEDTKPASLGARYTLVDLRTGTTVATATAPPVALPVSKSYIVTSLPFFKMAPKLVI